MAWLPFAPGFNPRQTFAATFDQARLFPVPFVFLVSAELMAIVQPQRTRPTAEMVLRTRRH
jgi:hypothetical protein